MLKRILIVIGIIVGVIALLGAIAVYYFMPSEHTVLDFIKDNPDKTSFKLIRNDSLLAEQNPDKIMPLASTVKIILAIEYAEQATEGLINPDSLIPLAELDKYYVANTDGGAHPEWLKSVGDKIENASISIREIAKGMIKYSSNANTEWLTEQLGLENINKRIDTLGIKNHSRFYHIVSALFVGKEKFPELKGEALVKELKELSLEEYIEVTHQVHIKLQQDTSYKKDISHLALNVQRVWSDNLPASTVAEYVKIMQKINSRTYFDSTTQLYLDEVMEYLLDNPANRQWLEHTGMKGGSTAFVLTKSLYATDKKGNKTEMAYFFNDLESLESSRLRMSMNEFELKILTNAEFREKVKVELRR